MKQYLLSVALVSSIALQSAAQGEKGFVGLSLGPNVPMGNFNSRNVNNGEAGFARTGGSFDISAGYKLGGSHFGITAMLRAHSNSYDVQPLVEDLKFQAPQVNWNVESSAWRMGGLLLGGFGSIPISEKVYFDARALVGIVNATSPQINITGSDATETFWVKRDARTARSFAYLFGAGFKFDIAPKWYLLTNIDYIGTTVEFPNIELTSSLGDRQRFGIEQEMASFNLSVGVALKL
jgi:hypothetical protein